MDWGGEKGKGKRRPPSKAAATERDYCEGCGLVAGDDDDVGWGVGGTERRSAERGQHAGGSADGKCGDGILHFIGYVQKAAGGIEGHAEGVLTGGEVGDMGQTPGDDGEGRDGAGLHVGGVDELIVGMHGYAEGIVVAADAATGGWRGQGGGGSERAGGSGNVKRDDGLGHVVGDEEKFALRIDGHAYGGGESGRIRSRGRGTG